MECESFDVRDCRGQLGELQGAGRVVHQRYAEEHGGRCNARQHQVLQRGFKRGVTFLRVSDEHVQRDGHDLEPEQNRCEVVRRAKHHGTQCCGYDQYEEFFRFSCPSADVAVCKNHGDDPGDDEKRVEEACESVHDHESRHHFRTGLQPKGNGDQRGDQHNQTGNISRRSTSVKRGHEQLHEQPARHHEVGQKCHEILLSHERRPPSPLALAVTDPARPVDKNPARRAPRPSQALPRVPALQSPATQTRTDWADPGRHAA